MIDKLTILVISFIIPFGWSGPAEFLSKVSQPGTKSGSEVVYTSLTSKFRRDDVGSCFSILKEFKLIISDSMDGFISEVKLEQEEKKNESAYSCGQNFLETASRNVTKIVGGTITAPGNFPWMVLIKKDSVQWCGAAVISPYHILTAAHCFTQDGVYEVGFGLHSVTDGGILVTLRTDQIHIHESYDKHDPYSTNDIAIITMDKSIEFTGNVQAICLPDLGTELDTPGNPAFVTGWGQTILGGEYSPILKQLEVVALKPSICEKSYSSFVSEMQICAGFPYGGGQDSCKGDSGGPLQSKTEDTDRWTIVGVVSYGDGCAWPNFPGVYTRVSNYLDWITKHAPLVNKAVGK